MSRSCPVCRGQGIIEKMRIKATKEIVYVCDECESLWPEGPEITAESSVGASEFFEARGGDPDVWWLETEDVAGNPENDGDH